MKIDNISNPFPCDMSAIHIFSFLFNKLGKKGTGSTLENMIRYSAI